MGAAERNNMMELVNGVPCFNCTEVANARKSGPQGQREPVEAAAQPRPAPASSEIRDLNQPLASGDRGIRINLAV